MKATAPHASGLASGFQGITWRLHIAILTTIELVRFYHIVMNVLVLILFPRFKMFLLALILTPSSL